MIGAAIISAVGAVASATGQIYAGEQQRKAANYNAEVQENQARAVDLQTREAIRRQRIKNEAILGAQRAAALASGVTEAGSTMFALTENSRLLEQNIADIATKGGADQYAAINSALLARMQGRAASTAGYIGGGGTLLSGVGGAVAGSRK